MGREVGKVAVVAVGGNALTRSGEQGTAAQIEANAEAMAAAICELLDSGRRVVIVHGNGPQVGNLAIQHESGVDMVPAQPLYSLNAMSQGQLGSALTRALDARRGAGAAVAVVSHMMVDLDDPAFRDPTKPIGPFFAADQVEALQRRRGWVMAEDSGRGHRRVVPSPVPQDFLELDAVRVLLAAGKVVLAAGGGGVGVHQVDGRFAGVDVVIDKDAAAAALASALQAEALIMLTGVDAVAIDFGTPAQRVVHEMSVAEARRHLADGQFPPGSMGPKMTAAIDFVTRSGGTAVIASPALLTRALRSGAAAGTRIVTKVMSPA